ncbi:MAG: hypothetical protein LBJ00_18600 [Planctomycetaceae bacterium]|jgi:hypothetical protein|nr:hypothetical protein [Planctomycetaceae bacterium]
MRKFRLYSSCFEIPEAEHASVASRSGCSRAKPTVHTGFGINFLLMAVICVCFMGCGERRTTITGLVKFTDGTPITRGFVIFDNGTNSFFGTIKENGTYATGAEKIVDGIPDGTYKVYLGKVNGMKPNPQTRRVEKIEVVNPKYCSVETTSLTFEVKRGGVKTFDIIVEKP